jgi:predicted GH43/DUF377 family glycosyl hydrolase
MKTYRKTAILLILTLLAFSLTLSQSVWTRYAGNPVLPVQNGLTHLFFPSVMYDATQHVYKMWFVTDDGTGNCISYALSNDGVNWTLYSGNPVMTKGQSGDFDSYSISGPCVIFNGTTYVMYFGANTSSSAASIGMATSSDGIHWTKREQPVLSGTPGTWNAYAVYHPSVYFDGDKYYMWYTASPSGVGLATSTDGIAWTNDVNNPILTASSTGWDSQIVGASSVVKIGATFYMFYLGTADIGRNHLIIPCLLHCPTAGRVHRWQICRLFI